MPSWHPFLICLVILCTSTCFVESQYAKCLNIEEVYPKKYFRKDGQSLTVNIETSTRMTHLLASQIFYIFAKEVLGYTKINITVREDYFQITDVMARLSDYADQQIKIPPATINLEVWTSPDYDTFEKEFVKEVGTVGPPGRFGWFIPQKYNGPIKNFYKDKFFWDDSIQEVHWSFFLNENLARSFNLDSTILNNLIKMNSIHMNEGNKERSYICPDPICRESMYFPPQCKGKSCAILLAPEYNASSFLIDQVNEMGVYVNILWLGKNLKSALKLLDQYYINKGDSRSYIFFHWYPGDVVKNEKDYTSVKFKNNEFYNFTNSMVNGYKYEMHRLVKMVWSKMEQGANPLFLGVRHFKLREEDYDYLLEQIEKNKMNVTETACQWMKNNKKIWSTWNVTTTPLIYIGGIFPLDTNLPFNGSGIFRAAKTAIDYINAKNQLIKGYKLQLILMNGRCQAESVMNRFLDFIVTKEYYNSLVGVLGPACSETIEPIAAVSKEYRVLTISYSAEGVSFADRNKYPYFFRTIGENQHYKHVYLALFKAFGWKRVAALTEDGQKYTEYISLMSDDLEKNHINFISNKKFPRGRNTDDMRFYLEDLKKQRARIIIADVVDHDARMVICEAFRLQMTAKEGYVWFLPVWLSPDWYNTTKYNEKEMINCSIDEMIEGANGYFSLTHAYYASDDSMMQENITVGKWKEKLKNSSNLALSNYAGFAYDAVWTYAFALSQLLQNDSEDMASLHSASTTGKLVNYIQNVDFHGVSGHIKFRGGSSRVSTINIVQWYDQQQHFLGSFYPNVSHNKPEIYGGELSLNGTAVKWFTPDGSIPEDGDLPPPTCAVEALARAFDVECQTAVIILNVIIAGLLLIGVICVCLYMKRRYDLKVQKTKNFMRQLGIPFDMNPTSDLDKWELRRELIVINRKLGEGAFGMVYGGEVELESRGWTPVAVKTLKVGSTTEDKLDFLSEAEVMKRFDHKNIVKLIGVCTKEEPVYTVMEYMLYGDLKTYLLARRHLVKSKDIDESEEVSSKRLTNIALDVARGLSYLAELKFVHRDIASRNCLVNDKRAVKIGDFGMTRAIFDSDYYKFTRRARLPVRWMAPESLALGVFTPASDVWSFGVLLYEIITFGNFPFQGKTNPEVLTEVKAGQTLQVPKAAKPQLVGLMNSCWKRESKERPTASQIVEFLANNPRLLTPCLDVPILSVQMGDSDELEMPSKNLKVSPSKSANGSVFQAPSSVYPENIPLEVCCPKEPLLGQGRGSSSNLLSKLGVGSKRESEEDDEYTDQNITDQDNSNV